MKKTTSDNTNPKQDPARNETADDILYGVLRLFQPQGGQGPRVNVDTILLAHFARYPARSKVLEMGCAHGAIALILAERRRRRHPQRRFQAIDAFDINPALVAMAVRNAELNGLGENVRFFHADLREHRDLFPAERYDAVVMNPPYDEPDRSRPSENPAMATAMHGNCASLREVVQAARYLLKNGGKLYLVLRAKRTGELFALLDELNMRPKRARFVHPKPGREASVVLVEAVRASGDGMRVEAPLCIWGDDGTYTEELLTAYRLEDAQ